MEKGVKQVRVIVKGMGAGRAVRRWAWASLGGFAVWEVEGREGRGEEGAHPPSPAFCYRAQSALKGLQGAGLAFVSITDTTPVPHNGCRPKKARRL